MEKYMGIELQERLDCTGYDLVKAIKKGVAKASKINATKKEERVYIDTTGPYPANIGGTHYLMCALNDFTDVSWLNFAKRNSEMVKFVTNLLQTLKGKGIKVEYIRFGNAGENMSKLRTLCQKEVIELEHTTPGSPRQTVESRRK